MENLKVNSFSYGIIDTIEDKKIPAGSASKSSNWLSSVDKIELRRGYIALGNEVAGTGKITSLYVANRSDGVDIAFRTRGKKLEYLKISNDTWTEIGSDLLGSDGDGKDVSYATDNGLFGNRLFVGSPYVGIIKIMLYNLDDYSSMYDSDKNQKGYIKIKQNRIFMNGVLKDNSSVFLSKVVHTDKIPDIVNEVADENIGTGDGTEKTFADTLAYRAGGDKRNCFQVTATDGTETLVDNKDGTLTGSAGGTGTINYTTGAISVTFKVAPAGSQAITSDYKWLDDTINGICDFDYTTPTRTEGEGDVLRQDDGGELMNTFSYGDVEYCLHKKKSWALTLTSDDTGATNFIHRDKVGIPARLAGDDTGNGIYYIDISDDKDPQLRLLTLSYGGEKVLPISISKAIKYKNKLVGIDLSDYYFDKAVVKEWGDFIILACSTDGVQNNIMFVYDKVKKTIDLVDFWASCLAVYNGTLIAGDPFVPNVYTLFSGFDDDDSDIPNYREGADIDLGVDGLKKVKHLIIEGDIGVDQTIKVSTQIDDGTFVEIGTIVGTGDYVDTGHTVSVGTDTIGSKPVGGGGSDVVAYHYMRQFNFNQGKFFNSKLRFEATGVGYASVSMYNYRDIRKKNSRIASKYRS